MAKPTNKPAEAKAETGKKNQKVRTPGLTKEQYIAQGPKGIVKFLALKAVAFAGDNKFEGVEGFGNNGKAILPKKDEEGKEVAQRAARNKIQPKWSPDGALYKLAEQGNSDSWTKLLKLAKAAQGDIGKSYSPAVKAFLQFMTEGSSGGVRSKDYSGLGGLL